MTDIIIKDGNIYERRTNCSTQEFTLDYTTDKTYYLSAVAYGEWNTNEFDTEDKLDEWLKGEWNFTEQELKDLKENMYVHGKGE